jgi:hypothetical protein
LVVRKARYKGKTCRVMVVCNRDTKETWRKIEERVDEREEEVLI